MKPTNSQRRSAQALIKKWRPKLYLNEWHVELIYMKDGPGHETHSVGGGDVIADINACPIYLQACVRIYPEFWKRAKWEQEKALVHELSHCLTQELFELVNALRRDESVSVRESSEKLERLTQRVTHIALYQQGK